MILLAERGFANREGSKAMATISHRAPAEVSLWTIGFMVLPMELLVKDRS